MIKLRSGKDIHSPVSVSKRRVESISIQRETQIEKEPQFSTLQHTSENSPATTLIKNDALTPADKNAVAPAQNMAKEKQSTQPATT